MESRSANLKLLDDPVRLREHIVRVLSLRCGQESLFRNESCELDVRTSSVMLLMGEQVPDNEGAPEVCVILNKRSKEVKQPGDLCCPGGAVDSVDSYLSKLLTLPGSVLTKWPNWRELKKAEPHRAQFLSLLLAAGLRESWEEMRLNPFGVRFLGPLPSQCLVLFRRVIHPMVAWISRQSRYTLSWEVERIVKIPVRELMNPFNYAHYRLYVPPGMEWRFRGRSVDFPCFVYVHQNRAELLWGVTYRTVSLFLELVFGFTPPDFEMLPLVPATVNEEYINGKAHAEHRQPFWKNIRGHRNIL